MSSLQPDRLGSSSLYDLVEMIESQPFEDQLRIFNSLNFEKAVQVFEYLSFKIQKALLNALPPERIASILNSIAPDDRTAFLEDLPKDITSQLLKYLSPQERNLTVKLLGYREDSIGRLMTPDYIAIKLNWTVEKVLDHVKKSGRDSETINIIYALDDQGRLVDDFRIQQFILADPKVTAETISDHKFISLNVNDDQEKALAIFRKYARIALPVIDDQGFMLGIVTIDDIIDVSVEEATEDIQKIGGSGALKETYTHISFFELLRKRSGWLIILFLGELLTASAMLHFQEEVAKAVVLALFIPLIISSGGNAGSQASTLIIRGLALGEIALKDWWKIFYRELLSGMILGCILGVIGFGRVSIWGVFTPSYGPHPLLLAITIFFSLIGVVVWGTLIGAFLPLLLKLLRFDPAVASAPLVATIVDVTGLIIYFTVAILVLQGTLL